MIFFIRKSFKMSFTVSHVCVCVCKLQEHCFHTQIAPHAMWSPLSRSVSLENSKYGYKKTADAEKARPLRVHLYRW